MTQTFVRNCYQCAAEIDQNEQICPNCGVEQFTDRRLPLRPAGSPAQTAAEVLLPPAIARYVAQGYRVTSQTPTTASLMKPKRFSVLMFLIWSCVIILPGILYVLYFWRKKDRTLYLYVENGRVMERHGKG